MRSDDLGSESFIAKCKPKCKVDDRNILCNPAFLFKQNVHVNVFFIKISLDIWAVCWFINIYIHFTRLSKTLKNSRPLKNDYELNVAYLHNRYIKVLTGCSITADSIWIINYVINFFKRNNDTLGNNLYIVTYDVIMDLPDLKNNARS